MSKSHLDLLHHISDEIDFLLSESTHTYKNAFLEDGKLKRACARSFEIIGEASKKIPNEIKDIYPEVEWKAMARMRDRLIHHYFGVDYELVWDIIKENIPIFKIQLEKILKDSKQDC